MEILIGALVGWLIGHIICHLAIAIAEIMQERKERKRLEKLEREVAIRREKTISEFEVKLGERNGIPKHVLYTRVLVNGWDWERAVDTPVRKGEAK